MEKPIYFKLINDELPAISLARFASIKPPYIHFKRKYHELILYYITSGTLYLTEGDREYTLEENDFLLLDPSREHFGRKTSTCRFLYIHFSLPLQETDLEKLDYGLIPKYHSVDTTETILAFRTLSEKLITTYHNRNIYHKKQAACYLYELLLLIASEHSTRLHVEKARINGAARKIIPDLITFLNQSYDMNISSELLEERYHYNFDYINRQFKKWTGQTIFKYLLSVRMECAKQLLSTDYYSLSDIARKTGFCDVYYFSKVFKTYTGVTPGNYRGAI